MFFLVAVEILNQSHCTDKSEVLRYILGDAKHIVLVMFFRISLLLLDVIYMSDR